jgi:transglutaminase-like putative cysteine protease
VRLALITLALGLVFKQYGTLLGRDAGSALLAVMLALKFLELRRLRDYMLGVFLIYFLIVIGFLYSQDMWLVLYLVAVFVATTATLVRLALPAVSGRRALRLATLLLAQALPLMLVLHLLFPRLAGPLWGLPQDALSGSTGLSETMQPGTINQLSLSEAIAFRARFSSDLPKASELYWRAIVLTRTDGRNWTRAKPVRAQLAYQAESPALHYTLTLEPSQFPWLPALEMPALVPEGARVATGLVLESVQLPRERRVFEMSAHTRYRMRALRPDERREALALPGPSARVQALATRLANNRQDAETVQAALAHFRQQAFYYTLLPPLLGDDPVDEFLFESRRGFCEHYSAAFVTLMRAAGIPARVVTGYQGGEFNPAGRYFIVRQSDAHAWAEVWLAGRGWTRVDPTAAVAPERIEYGADALRRLVARGARLGELVPGALDLDWFERVRRDTRLTLDTVQNGWQRWVLGYNLNRQREFLTALGLNEYTGARLVGLLALVIATVIGAYVLASWPRPTRRDPVQGSYRRLCRKLARIGLVRAPHEGPVAFTARCIREHPALTGPLHALTGQYVELRYGHDPAAGAVLDFRRQVAAFRPARRARRRP